VLDASDGTQIETIQLIVVAVGGGMFTASLDGMVLCCSRQPFVDSARVLIQSGWDPAAMLVMRHAGADHDALTARIGTAASLSISDDRYGRPKVRRWTASCGDVAGLPVQQIERPATPGRAAA
jgi:hypothetical protein